MGWKSLSFLVVIFQFYKVKSYVLNNFFYSTSYSRIVAEMELELFHYVNNAFFFFWSELKLERDFPVFVSILFSIGSKTKCIGHWGLLHHLCHPCLLWPPVVRECMQSGNDDRYRGITYNDTDDFSKYCTDFFQKFLKGLPPNQNKT